MTSPTPQQVVAHLRFLRSLGWTHLPPTLPFPLRPPDSTAPAMASPPSEQPTAPIPEPPAPAPRAPEPESAPEAEPLAAAGGETLDLFGGAGVEPAAPPVPPALPVEERRARLRAREAELRRCERCKLCDNRTNLVYGVGNPEAEIVFVGEGPGEQEDLQGEPFVGRAGELLTKVIEAMGLRRKDVYICNVVKCRPPGNREPEADEIAACEPFLIEQLDLIRPRVLVTLGNCATKTLLRAKQGITKLRGRWHAYHGIPTMPTYHTAYLLRSYTRENREAVWRDMQAVLAKLDEIRGRQT